jgi:undecaprenyl-diphosphatase
MSLDAKIVLLISDLSGKYSILDGIGIFMADLMMYAWLGVIIALWFKKEAGYRPNVYQAFVNIVISRLFIVEILKRLFERARPFEVLDIKPLIFDEDALRSFPSGHTAIYFSIAFAFYGTKYFKPFLVLAIIGSLSRVFVGVHYLSDVLASVIIALVVAIAVRFFTKRWK